MESNLSEAVKICLDNWTAMKLAIDMGWGEDYHKINLQNELTNYIMSFDVTRDDISDYLDDIMEQRFSVILDDESSRDIAVILLKVFEESAQGRQDELSKLRNLHSADTELCRKVKPQPDLVQGMEGLNIEPPQLVPLVDEDGFETVTGKKNKRKK